jgi:hypothetical protein
MRSTKQSPKVPVGRREIASAHSGPRNDRNRGQMGSGQGAVSGERADVTAYSLRLTAYGLWLTADG